MDAVERREAVALTNSPIRRARQVQRIEQGMGRGVRDVDDYCAVLLLGANLAVATHDIGWLGLFSPATRAQLELSRDIAMQISGQGLDRYVDIGAVRAEAVAAREAFDLAVAGDTAAPADRLQRTINEYRGPGLRGWLREQKAAYRHFTDPVLAQQQLRRVPVTTRRLAEGHLRPDLRVTLRR